LESTEDDELSHIGIARRSGRYPWGSGGDKYQRSRDFKAYYDEMKKAGLSDTQIAEGIGIHLSKTPGPAHFKTTDLRAAISSSTEHIAEENRIRATNLKKTNMSNTAIAKEMGTNESTVRGWLKQYEGIKENSLRATTEHLKAEVERKPFLDVGKGINLYMGISDTKLRTSLAMLKDEGYEVHSVKLPQLGTDKLTTYRVLAKPGTPWADSRKAVIEGRLKTVAAQSDDNGQTYKTAKSQPVSVDSNRIAIKWGDTGGKEMDGVIELRRGVDDLSLGNSKYAQVRVGVDGTHYLKGMAMYTDDLPKGVDIRFNTNKTEAEAGGTKHGAMKPMKTADGKVDPDNPFGATTYQRTYKGKDGKDHTSPLNIVNEEGAWDKWSNALSSQMLSKQSLTLATNQLGKTQAAKEKDLGTILKLTNPVVRQKLLEEYADSADAAAVHLKAAALPRQSNHVILPISSIRPHEIYAPNFDNGDKVVLVRHPHGGPFEIPELTVNKNNAQARRILGGAKDAVGIHHSVAAQLSGADFDGDTVLVIRNNNRQVKTQKPWKELQEFDAKEVYKIPEGNTTTKRMTKQNTQSEMGKISNLITDMSIHNANKDELIRAVKHSMVVIDAEKHGLDYKQSEKDNGIAHLKTKYQGGANRGAATIISRASSDARVPKIKQLSGRKGVDPKTGEKVFVRTNESFQRPIKDKKTGLPTGKFETVEKTTKGALMEFTKNARDLMSTNPQPMEKIYADHANAMKGLGNKARKEWAAIVPPKQSAAAKAVYAKEVKSLDAKLKVALRNAPLERRAQAIGNAMAKARIDANPGIDKDDIKKIKFQSLEDARHLTGAAKIKIGAKDEQGNSTLTAREWEAIQAGAVSHTKLREILTHADMERVKELATPRVRTSLSPGQLARARQMEASGRSLSEIASELGIPRSTISDNLAP
jgi:hypothetical protein